MINPVIVRILAFIGLSNLSNKEINKYAEIYYGKTYSGAYRDTRWLIVAVFIIVTVPSLILITINKRTPATVDLTVADISGTWSLVSYEDSSSEIDQWKSYPENVIYQKFITKNCFAWFKYDTAKLELLEMGGGTIGFKNGIYVENYDFYYPERSQHLGQSIPFTMELREGKLYNKGYLKNWKIDFDLGHAVLVDSTKIEQLWTPVLAQQSNDLSLVGTWSLKHSRDDLNSSFYDIPEMLGQLRLFTPTHFFTVKYDREGDKIFEALSGTYSFDGKSYSENIDMTYLFERQAGESRIQVAVSEYRLDFLAITESDEFEKPIIVDEVYQHFNTVNMEDVAIHF